MITSNIIPRWVSDVWISVSRSFLNFSQILADSWGFYDPYISTFTPFDDILQRQYTYLYWFIPVTIVTTVFTLKTMTLDCIQSEKRGWINWAESLFLFRKEALKLMLTGWWRDPQLVSVVTWHRSTVSISTLDADIIVMVQWVLSSPVLAAGWFCVFLLSTFSYFWTHVLWRCRCYTHWNWEQLLIVDMWYYTSSSSLRVKHCKSWMMVLKTVNQASQPAQNYSTMQVIMCYKYHPRWEMSVLSLIESLTCEFQVSQLSFLNFPTS